MEKEEIEIFEVFGYYGGTCFLENHNYALIKKINFYKTYNHNSKFKSKLVLICKKCGKVKTVDA